jgi:hypothetical protein
MQRSCSDGIEAVKGGKGNRKFKEHQKLRGWCMSLIRCARCARCARNWERQEQVAAGKSRQEQPAQALTVLAHAIRNHLTVTTQEAVWSH